MPAGTVYFNGRWLEAGNAAIPIEDRGFLYGDAIFETGRLHRGGYFRLERHLDRLAEGAAVLELPLPTRDALRDIAVGLAERNAVEEAGLRITVTRGSPGAEPLVLGTLAPLPDEWRSRAAAGWRVATATVPHPPPGPLSRLKTPGRLHGLLARRQARREGADDALLLSQNGAVAEGPTWNVFWRTGGMLRTPAAKLGLLEGVTRAALLELAARAGFSVQEGSFARAELDSADEIFATMSSLGIVPFRSLDDRVLEPAARRAAEALAPLYWDLVAREAGAERASRHPA